MKIVNGHGRLAAKGLLMLASFTGCSASMAQSSVQMYGLLDLWMGSSKNSGDVASTKVINSGGMRTSFWGFAGAEDLGSGNRALFTLEGFLLLDTGAAGRYNTDAMFARNSNVGIGGSSGEIRVGRVGNPLFYSTAASTPFGGSSRFGPLIAQLWTPQLGRVIYGDTSWDNAIQYALPQIGPFRITTQYGFGEVAGNSGTKNLSLNLVYSEGPWYGTFGAQQVKAGPGLGKIGISEQKTYFLGSSYDLKTVKLFASYGQSKANTPDLRSRTAQLGISVPVGIGDILMSWARTKNDQNTVPNNRNSASLGYEYYLSKRTKLYVVEMYDKSSVLAKGNSFGLGIQHCF